MPPKKYKSQSQKDVERLKKQQQKVPKIAKKRQVKFDINFKTEYDLASDAERELITKKYPELVKKYFDEIKEISEEKAIKKNIDFFNLENARYILNAYNKLGDLFDRAQGETLKIPAHFAIYKVLYGKQNKGVYFEGNDGMTININEFKPRLNNVLNDASDYIFANAKPIKRAEAKQALFDTMDLKPGADIIISDLRDPQWRETAIYSLIRDAQGVFKTRRETRIRYLINMYPTLQKEHDEREKGYNIDDRAKKSFKNRKDTANFGHQSLSVVNVVDHEGPEITTTSTYIKGTEKEQLIDIGKETGLEIEKVESMAHKLSSERQPQEPLTIPNVLSNIMQSEEPTPTRGDVESLTISDDYQKRIIQIAKTSDDLYFKIDSSSQRSYNPFTDDPSAQRSDNPFTVSPAGSLTSAQTRAPLGQITAQQSGQTTAPPHMYIGTGEEDYGDYQPLYARTGEEDYGDYQPLYADLLSDQGSEGAGGGYARMGGGGGGTPAITPAIIGNVAPTGQPQWYDKLINPDLYAQRPPLNMTDHFKNARIKREHNQLKRVMILKAGDLNEALHRNEDERYLIQREYDGRNLRTI